MNPIDTNRPFLPIDAMNPTVLASNLFSHGMQMPKDYRLPYRHVYDYELEFFLESDGGMLIDDVFHPIAKGDLVFRRPGQTTQGIMPYQCYLICFDITGNSGKSRENFNFCSNQNDRFQYNYTNSILDAIPNVFHPAAEGRYLGLFDNVLKAFIHQTESSPMLLKAYTLQILHQLYQDLREPLIIGAAPSSPYGAAVKQAVDYARNNLGASLSLSTLARQANLSPTYFHKVFRDVLGVTPNEYITNLRIEHAKELLVRTNMQIYRVAQECGIENIPYFSYIFKKRLGISPQEYRRRHSYA
jgi:AraC family transcriptional regulator